MHRNDKNFVDEFFFFDDDDDENNAKNEFFCITVDK